jgi:hypothetical protein
MQVAVERDEPAAHAPDRRTIIAAEIGDGFEIGVKPPVSQMSSRLRRHSRSNRRDD